MQFYFSHAVFLVLVMSRIRHFPWGKFVFLVSTMPLMIGLNNGDWLLHSFVFQQTQRSQVQFCQGGELEIRVHVLSFRKRDTLSPAEDLLLGVLDSLLFLQIYLTCFLTGDEFHLIWREPASFSIWELNSFTPACRGNNKLRVNTDSNYHDLHRSTW